MDFLCETALLTHGLASVDADALLHAWDQVRDTRLAWVDQGVLTLGTMEEYLPFRARAAEVCRIDCDTLATALEQGSSGALTASGTMAACAMLGVDLAVTAGMGGIGDIAGEELCPDLPALARFGVALIATSPKDMLDRQATIGWLLDHGVHVASDSPCSGYVFVGDPIDVELTLDACGSAERVRTLARAGGLLILNPIPLDLRVTDLSILKSAIDAGHEAQRHGGYYHPAANAQIDRLTQGRSSAIQLDALVANVRLARGL